MSVKFTIEKSALWRAIKSVSGVVPTRSPMAILFDIMLTATEDDGLSAAASDLDTFLTTTVACETVEAGSICLPAKDLLAIVRNLPDGVVTLAARSSSTVSIAAGAVSYDLLGHRADDYPQPPRPESGTNFVTVDTATLSHMIENTLFSTAVDDPRIFLNGVNFERLDDATMRMVSTDGHRMSLCDGAILCPFGGESENGAVILPHGGLGELAKLLASVAGGQTDLCVGRANMYAKMGDTEMVMRLVEGGFPDYGFPDYKLVIPKDKKYTVTMDADALSDAIARVSILSADKASPHVRVSFGGDVPGGSVLLESANPDRGSASESVSADLGGHDDEKLSVGVNAKYAIEAIRRVPGGTVCLDFVDELAPIVVRHPDRTSRDGLLFVIMPMRA